MTGRIMPTEHCRVWLKASLKRCERRAHHIVRHHGEREHLLSPQSQDTIALARRVLALLERLDGYE